MESQTSSRRTADGVLGSDFSMLDRLPVGIILADRDGAALYANRAWTELTGQNPTWRGHGWFDVIERDRRRDEMEQLLDSLRADLAYESDWTVPAADGKPRVLHVSAVPNADGEIGLVVSAHDVTAERDRTARLLHAATHDSLTGLLNRAHFLEFVGHALARLRRHPSRTSAVFFIDVNDLKATNDTFGHDYGDRLLQEVAARATAAVRPGDVVARFGGDEFTVLCEDLAGPTEARAIADRIRATPPQFADDVPRFELSVGFAIADDPNADPASVVGRADLAMYEDRWRTGTHAPRERSQPARRPHPADPRPDDGGSFALLATAAHELRTPLATVLGFAARLREHRDRMTPSDIDSAVGAIERQAEKLAGMLDGLLDIGRLRHGNNPSSGPVDLRKVIAEAIRSAPTPDGTTVEVLPPPNGAKAMVAAHAATLSPLVVNLLTNAYAAGGERITITISSDAASPDLQLSIEDDGPGVSPEIRATIFEPFVTHQIAGQGQASTGLGLPICKEIAEAFGGSLVHEPVHPHGARFILTVPVAPQR